MPLYRPERHTMNPAEIHPRWRPLRQRLFQCFLFGPEDVRRAQGGTSATALNWANGSVWTQSAQTAAPSGVFRDVGYGCLRDNADVGFDRPEGASLSLSGPYTLIELAIWDKSAPGNLPGYMMVSSDGNSYGVYKASDDTFYSRPSSQFWQATGYTGATNDTTLEHIAFVWPAGTSVRPRLYADGVLVDTASSDIGQDSTFGCNRLGQSTSTTYSFEGVHFGIWHFYGELSDDEIMAHYLNPWGVTAWEPRSLFVVSGIAAAAAAAPSMDSWFTHPPEITRPEVKVVPY